MILVRFGRSDFNAECGRAEAWTDADSLGGQPDVLEHLRWPQVRSLFVDGHIHFAELELRNPA
jgi:hypothetical protein